MSPADVLVNDLTRAHEIARNLSKGVTYDMRLSDTLSEIEGIRTAAKELADAFQHALQVAHTLRQSEGDEVRGWTQVLSDSLQQAENASRTLRYELEVNWTSRTQDRKDLRTLDAFIATAHGFEPVSEPVVRATSSPEIPSTSPIRRPGEVARSKASRRLTDWAARILPAADRLEYTELFHAELYDLANSGCGRRAQIAYALRVLARAPWLRRELSVPTRERSW